MGADYGRSQAVFNRTQARAEPRELVKELLMGRTGVRTS
jgi:hypothetical protein